MDPPPTSSSCTGLHRSAGIWSGSRHAPDRPGLQDGMIDKRPEREKTPMTVSRRAFALGSAAIAGLAALPASAQSALSAEDRAILAQAQTYLQGLTSAQGNFTETSGAQTREGRFYLQRPGKMRFEYTNPAGLLVVSDGSNVKRYDPRLNNFQQVPLGQTPLSTFLARNVRLDQGVRIDRVQRMAGGAYTITARDSRRPTDGSVTLGFYGSPVRLQEWTITD